MTLSRNAIKITIAFFLLFVFLSLFSCKKASYTPSFSGTLALIDSYILQFNMSDAITYLKKLSKRASSPEQILSVYKRYTQIGESKLAEQVLQRGYKMFSSSLKIIAVYVHHLMSAQRFSEAVELAKLLEGSEYGSLYAELQFRTIPNQAFLLAPEFYTNFVDAAAATKDSTYIQNAAVIKALNGNIDEAMKLHPKTLALSDNPLFWAQLAYDSENYFQSLFDIELSESSFEALLIQADIYMQLGKIDEAITFYLSICAESPDYSAVPYLNIAYNAKLKQNWDMQYTFLSEAVEKFPNYTYGLCAYAQLALDLNKPEKNDVLGNAVRKTGLRTLKMQSYDNRPKILLADPLARMLTAYELTGDNSLLLEIYKFTNAIKGISPVQIKKSDIWQELEKYKDNEYLLQYFTWILMCQHEYDDAASIFFSHFYNKYQSQSITVEILQNMAAWEKEYFAYFSARLVPNAEYPNYSTPLLLLKNLYETKKLLQAGLLNYALIYESNQDYTTALELYSLVSAEEEHAKIKSEAQYRMGRIYAALFDLKNATLSLNYSLKLDNANNRARLLLKKISS